MRSTKTQRKALLKQNMSRKELGGFIGLVALALLDAEPLAHPFDRREQLPIASGNAYGRGDYGRSVYKQSITGTNAVESPAR